MVGLSGTGKTTIGMELAKKFAIPFIPEPVVPFVVPKELSSFPMPFIEERRINLQIAAEGAHADFVTDAPMPVLLAQLMVLTAAQYDLMDKRKQSDDVFTRAQEQLKKYDVFVYLTKQRHRVFTEHRPFNSLAVDYALTSLMFELCGGCFPRTGDPWCIILGKSIQTVENAACEAYTQVRFCCNKEATRLERVGERVL